MENVRDDTFDIMKGIAILLMLLGHWPGCPEWLHQFIYSFHMPLFFLVAGYFTRTANSYKEIRVNIYKSARRLLIPFVFTQLMLIAWTSLQAIAKHDTTMLVRAFLSLLWGGDVIDSRWGQIYVGHIWFLPALFFAKSIFSYLSFKLQGYKLPLVCIAISCFANIINVYVHLPWCIIPGMSGIVFILLGWLARNYDIPRWIYIICLLVWPFAIIFSSLEMYACSYRYYPLDVIGACGGTVCMWWIAKHINRNKAVAYIFRLCGVYSLVILCMHNFEWFSAIAYSIVIHSPFSFEGNAMVSFRYALTFFMTAIVVRIPYIRTAFGIIK